MFNGNGDKKSRLCFVNKKISISFPMFSTFYIHPLYPVENKIIIQGAIPTRLVQIG